LAELQNSNEIDHDAAEAAVQTFSFKAPETYAKRKAIVRLTSNDRGQTAVHCLGQGGENNLHYHAGVDITWMVLKGRALLRQWRRSSRRIRPKGRHPNSGRRSLLVRELRYG
jgi:quercetin dioxygenase-like cupin family protein